MLNWARKKYYQFRWNRMYRFFRNEDNYSSLFAGILVHWPYVEDGWYRMDGGGLVAVLGLEGDELIRGSGETNKERVVDVAKKYLIWLAEKWGIEDNVKSDEKLS